jgi:hypothetical protein
MIKTISVLFLVGTASLQAEEGLINSEYTEKVLLYQAPWSVLHGASKTDLGAGLLYYSLVYSSKAQVCVCLGSGDGFVPRMMRQAQRDLCLDKSRTILVDGNTGPWGRPLWLHKGSFLRTIFPDIEIVLDTTQHVSIHQAKEWSINYLHIDADRTVAGALEDFKRYLPYMAKGSIITLHDTGPSQPCAQVVKCIRDQGYSVVNLEHLGTGVALIYIP